MKKIKRIFLFFLSKDKLQFSGENNLYLEFENLTIRDAAISDAELLTKWWNDGSIMIDVGFPYGLGKNVQKVKNEIERREFNLLILELNKIPIGEMNYKKHDEQSAAIGIKICDSSLQNKGLGKKYLSLLISSLFNNYGYKKIVLDTALNNKRAQHVYEQIGFRKLGIRENCWRDQVGNLQSAVDYELTEYEFIDYTTR